MSGSQLGRRTDRSTRVLASTASLRSDAIGRESLTGESAVNEREQAGSEQRRTSWSRWASEIVQPLCG